jgi:acyl-CoA thioesterase-2
MCGACSAGERNVLDAQVSFAVPIAAPRTARRPPSRSKTRIDCRASTRSRANGRRRSSARSATSCASSGAGLPFRSAPDGLRLELPTPRLRFWVRTRSRLPDDPVLHAAVFAYLSDWWLNYPASGGHQAEAEALGGLYVASLNHALWLHHPPRVDEWLHFDSVSPAAASGRGLSIARVHDRAGRLVASCTQECLMVPRTA